MQQPEPEPTPAPKEVEKKLPLIVLGGVQTFEVAGYQTDIVRQAFTQRLREAGVFDISSNSTRSSRGDANRRAKAEKDRYIVWIELRYDGMRRGGYPTGMRRPNPEDYRIEYGVYEPLTAKSKAQGIVFPRPSVGIFGGRVGVPGCYPSVSVYDAEFVRAGIEAADRVIKAFGFAPPPLCG